MMYHGYAGRILYVDLSHKTFEVLPTPEEYIEQFLGGWGINYRLALDLLDPQVSPLSPENPIIIGAGPFVGTLAPSSSKIFATSKFPVTGQISSFHGGSRLFGLMMKNAGYDHIVISGQSENPVCLVIEDDSITFRPADDLWGKADIYQTTDRLMNETGGGVIAIGAAGENGVAWSLALVDKISTLGKGGLGALMGHKGLKAVVAKGSRGIDVADPKGFFKYYRRFFNEMTANASFESWAKLSAHAGWEGYQFPLNPRIWSRKEWDKRYGVATALESMRWNKSCSGCVFPCRAWYDVKEEASGADGPGTGGYFILMGILGQRLGLTDYRETLKLVSYCNQTGICYFTFMDMADFFMGLVEEGELPGHIPDMPSRHRNLDTYLQLAESIAQNRGVGKLFNQGWEALGRAVGKDPVKAYSGGQGIVKGQTCIYDARSATFDPMRISMCVNPRGGYSAYGHSASVSPDLPLEVIQADARQIGITPEEYENIFGEKTLEELQGIYPAGFHPGRLLKHVEDAYSVYNCLGNCDVPVLFGVVNLHNLAEIYNLLTGRTVEPGTLKRAGERVYNLYRLLNGRAGFSRKDDKVPENWFVAHANPEGDQGRLTDYSRRKNLVKEDAEKIMEDYYRERGWDPVTAAPTSGTLKRLGLDKL